MDALMGSIGLILNLFFLFLISALDHFHLSYFPRPFTVLLGPGVHMHGCHNLGYISTVVNAASLGPRVYLCRGLAQY